MLLDLRNHGQSADRSINPPHTMDTAAKDLADLVRVECWPWPKVVIGHSMGGKWLCNLLRVVVEVNMVINIMLLCQNKSFFVCSFNHLFSYLIHCFYRILLYTGTCQKVGAEEDGRTMGR